ncbi:MAG: hypothetical protein JW894_16250 [Bacteroidales bacterium]|nr:hypothetical protein [Bacteroidales bacterium]
MITFRLSSVLILVLILVSGCKKIKDYFHEPETEVVAQTIETAYIAGYAANIAMTVMKGYHVPNVRAVRTGSGEAGTALININPQIQPSAGFITDRAQRITVAGIFAGGNSAVLTILLSNFDAVTTTYTLLEISTIPVVELDGNLLVVFAGMDFDFDPETDGFLSFNLTEQEFDSEILRLYEQQPDDIYVAFEQDAYFISVVQNNTPGTIDDDDYYITGGGQLFEITSSSTEIFQQAMFNVHISDDCMFNPTAGYALLKKVNIEDNSFPELGTALLEFHSSCDSRVDVVLGTGVYIGSNGNSIEYRR